MLEPSLSSRLSLQLAAFLAVVRDAGADLAWTPPTGKWSALQNLAHVGRHHEVMLDRLGRVLVEDRPAFPRYREDEDPGWAEWSHLHADEVCMRLLERRAELLAWAEALSPAQVQRVGVHAKFGAMSIAGWLEFFLVHEAHHFYVALQRLAEARAAHA